MTAFTPTAADSSQLLRGVPWLKRKCNKPRGKAGKQQEIATGPGMPVVRLFMFTSHGSNLGLQQKKKKKVSTSHLQPLKTKIKQIDLNNQLCDFLRSNGTRKTSSHLLNFPTYPPVISVQPLLKALFGIFWHSNTKLCVIETQEGNTWLQSVKSLCIHLPCVKTFSYLLCSCKSFQICLHLDCLCYGF